MAKLVNVKFKATTKGATRAALPAIARDFNKIFRRNKSILENYARDAVLLSIRSHPTYESLISDSPTSLHAELGLEDPIGQTQPILDRWESGIKVVINDVRAAGTRLYGGFEIIGINASFRDVGAMPTASFYAERARAKGISPSLIAWLDWLLLEGNNPLVFGYFVDTDLKPRDNSRTGLAVMRDERVARLSGVEWRLDRPGSDRGLAEDNWITQAVFDVVPEIEAYIVDTIIQQLGPVQRLSR